MNRPHRNPFELDPNFYDDQNGQLWDTLDHPGGPIQRVCYFFEVPRLPTTSTPPWKPCTMSFTNWRSRTAQPEA